MAENSASGVIEVPVASGKGLPVLRDFGYAILHLKAGKRVTREGWNGKGMWIVMQVPDAYSKMSLPYLYIEYPEGHAAYPSGSRVPWLASQTDMLSEDWVVLED